MDMSKTKNTTRMLRYGTVLQATFCVPTECTAAPSYQYGSRCPNTCLPKKCKPPEDIRLAWSTLCEQLSKVCYAPGSNAIKFPKGPTVVVQPNRDQRNQPTRSVSTARCGAPEGCESRRLKGTTLPIWLLGTSGFRKPRPRESTRGGSSSKGREGNLWEAPEIRILLDPKRWLKHRELFEDPCPPKSRIQKHFCY